MNETSGTVSIPVNKFVGSVSPSVEELKKISYGHLKPKCEKGNQLLSALMKDIVTSVLRLHFNHGCEVYKNKNGMYAVPFFSSDTDGQVEMTNDVSVAIIGSNSKDDPVLIGVISADPHVRIVETSPNRMVYVSILQSTINIARFPKWEGVKLDQWLRKAASSEWEGME